MLNRGANAEPLVTLSDVGVRRGGRWLVRGVDLSIAPGEIVTLIGPNGSGKSTTAKAALGILKADQGTVRRRHALRIGYVPQKLSIDRTLPLTVRRLMALTEKQTDADISTALEEVGLATYGDAEVQHLSGGEFQRALLARAIVRKPDLLILDEPVQGVDFNGETALYDLIGTIRDRTGCGILLISHDLHVVMAGTDTVICLNGHVCCRGAPDLVAKSPEYLRLFGARAASSLALYRHDHDHTHLPDGRVRHADGTVTDDCHPEDGHHDHHHRHHDRRHGHELAPAAGRDGDRNDPHAG